VTAGSGVHRVNGVAHTVRAGSAFLLTPADFHELSAVGPEPVRYHNVVIDPVLLEASLDELFAALVRPGAWLVDGADDLEEDFRRLSAESAEKRPASDQMSQALLRCILIELVRRSPVPSAPTGARGADQGDMRRAVLYVDHHFREPLTLSRVAAQAHLSPNYFSERFRELTGTSFQTYLQRRRLTFARSLLATTHLGVTEVCHAAGFNSLSHFGRAYRSHYGQSPTHSRTRLESPYIGAGTWDALEAGGPVGRPPL
jgi:AraC-like DNA-binding protein